MRRFAGILVTTVSLVALASPAYAIRCREWTRMDTAAQRRTLSHMIDEAPNRRSLYGRQVNGARLQMCLRRSESWIEADFHEACSRGQRESLQVLNNIFEQYISSCTSGRVGGYY